MRQTAAARRRTAGTSKALMVIGPSQILGCLDMPPDVEVSKRHSNPIAGRIRGKRQRLPSSLLIENASGRSSRHLPVVRRGVSDQGWRLYVQVVPEP